MASQLKGDRCNSRIGLMGNYQIPWRGGVGVVLLLLHLGCSALNPGEDFVHPESGFKYTILGPHNIAESPSDSPILPENTVNLELGETVDRDVVVEDLGAEFSAGLSWKFSPIKRIGRGADGSVFVAAYQSTLDRNAEPRYAVVKVIPCNRVAEDLCVANSGCCSSVLHRATKEYNWLLSLGSFDPADRSSYAGTELIKEARKLTNEAGKRILKPVDKPFVALVGKKRNFDLASSEEDIDRAALRNAVIETFEMISPQSNPDKSVTLYTGMKQLFDDSAEIAEMLKPGARNAYQVVMMGRILLQTIYQVLQGAALISASNLVHRDIKGNNIVVRPCNQPGTCSWSTAMEIKFIDFYNTASCDNGWCPDCKAKLYDDYQPQPLHDVYTDGYTCPEGIVYRKLHPQGGAQGIDPGKKGGYDDAYKATDQMCEEYPTYAIDSFSVGVVLLMMMNMGNGFSGDPDQNRFVVSQAPDIAKYCLMFGINALNPDEKVNADLFKVLTGSNAWTGAIRGIEYCWRDSVVNALGPDFDESTSDTVKEDTRRLTEVINGIRSGQKSQALNNIIFKLLQCHPLTRISPMVAFTEFYKEFVAGTLQYDVYRSTSTSVRSGKRSRGTSPVFIGNKIAVGTRCNSLEYTGCIFLEIDEENEASDSFGATAFTIRCTNDDSCVLESQSNDLLVRSTGGRTPLNVGDRHVLRHNDKISLCPNVNGQAPGWSGCDGTRLQEFEWKFPEVEFQ